MFIFISDARHVTSKLSDIVYNFYSGSRSWANHRKFETEAHFGNSEKYYPQANQIQHCGIGGVFNFGEGCFCGQPQ